MVTRRLSEERIEFPFIAFFIGNMALLARITVTKYRAPLVQEIIAQKHSNPLTKPAGNRQKNPVCYWLKGLQLRPRSLEQQSLQIATCFVKIPQKILTSEKQPPFKGLGVYTFGLTTTN